VNEKIHSTTILSVRRGNAVVVAGDGQVTLGWNDNVDPDLASYTLQRTTDAPSASSRDWTSIQQGLTSSDAVDTTTQNGTTYYYRVRAVDLAGNVGPASAEASAMPLPAGIDYPPTTVSVTTGTALGDPIEALFASDGVLYRVNSVLKGTKQVIDWQTKSSVPTPTGGIVVVIQTSNSVPATTDLMIKNVVTGAWVHMATSTVGPTGTTSFWSASTASNYVSKGLVTLRVNVKGSTGPFVSSTDLALVRFTS
jgi:hypothetical protein